MEIKELGHVVLFVSNLQKSADFYKEILGFKEIVRYPGASLFSSGRTHHELLLIEVGGMPERSYERKPGLYHIGLKIGDGRESARAVYRELEQKGVQIVGTADHTITHSIYILDPDGNELELYADVSDVWKENPLAIMTPTKPLDLS